MLLLTEGPGCRHRSRFFLLGQVAVGEKREEGKGSRSTIETRRKISSDRSRRDPLLEFDETAKKFASWELCFIIFCAVLYLSSAATATPRCIPGADSAKIVKSGGRNLSIAPLDSFAT